MTSSARRSKAYRRRESFWPSASFHVPNSARDFAKQVDKSNGAVNSFKMRHWSSASRKSVRTSFGMFEAARRESLP